MTIHHRQRSHRAIHGLVALLLCTTLVISIDAHARARFFEDIETRADATLEDLAGLLTMTCNGDDEFALRRCKADLAAQEKVWMGDTIRVIGVPVSVADGYDFKKQVYTLEIKGVVAGDGHNTDYITMAKPRRFDESDPIVPPWRYRHRVPLDDAEDWRDAHALNLEAEVVGRIKKKWTVRNEWGEFRGHVLEIKAWRIYDSSGQVEIDGERFPILISSPPSKSKTARLPADLAVSGLVDDAGLKLVEVPLTAAVFLDGQQLKPPGFRGMVVKPGTHLLAIQDASGASPRPNASFLVTAAKGQILELSFGGRVSPTVTLRHVVDGPKPSTPLAPPPQLAVRVSGGKPTVTGRVAEESAAAVADQMLPHIQRCYRSVLGPEQTHPVKVTVQARVAADGSVAEVASGDNRTFVVVDEQSPSELRSCIMVLVETVKLTPGKEGKFRFDVKLATAFEPVEQGGTLPAIRSSSDTVRDLTRVERKAAMEPVKQIVEKCVSTQGSSMIVTVRVLMRADGSIAQHKARGAIMSRFRSGMAAGDQLRSAHHTCLDKQLRELTLKNPAGTPTWIQQKVFVR